MTWLFPTSASPKDRLQSGLMSVAALFVIAYAAALMLSPAVVYHDGSTPLRWTHWLGAGVWLTGFSLVYRKLRQIFPERDPYLLPVIGFLTGWGLLTIWRLDESLGLRQSLWLAICLAVFWVGLQTPRLLIRLRRYKYAWLVGGLLLTLLTFFFGVYPGGEGPHLWLGCCGVYFQPSELLKLLLTIYLAAYLADRVAFSFNFLSLLLPTLVLTGVALVTLVAQRDLGGATLFIAVYAVLIYLGTGKRWVLILAGLVLLGAAIAGYQLFDVIRIRVEAWLMPWLDPSGKSYQVVQSLIAVAVGGVFGRGPGLGHPGLIPVSFSDLIFSAIAEEFGLTGSLALLGLIALLVGRSLLIALRAPNQYLRNLAAGIGVFLAVQSLLIIGGSLRLLPLTGMTLPFVSYGGSSLLTSFLAVLLLTLINGQPETDPAGLPSHQPYTVIGGLLLAGLVAAGLFAGYWAVVRNSELQNRSDNLRQAITDLYIPRGQILDRSGLPIVTTTGPPGDYVRQVNEPSLGPITGYANLSYGLSGLEASYDPYLRAIQGSSVLDFWSYHILYSQRPQGLDLRLTVDLALQRRAATLMQNKTGALVVLNAQTGEILAITSQPAYDPNFITEKWKEWSQANPPVLINRASQGQYSPGTLFGPFLLVDALQAGSLSSVPGTASVDINGRRMECALPPAGSDWGSIISRGCPNASVQLAHQIPPDQLANLYSQLGLLQVPNSGLPAASSSSDLVMRSTDQAALGQGGIKASPLQMALAAAALSNGGERPAARIVSAYQPKPSKWLLLPVQPATRIFTPASVTAALQYLESPAMPIWQAVGQAPSVTWYMGGTTSNWQGVPLTLALVLEEDNPAEAERIGSALLHSLLTQP